MAKCHILVDLSLKQGCDLCDKTKPLVYVGDDFRMNKYFFEKLLLAKNVNRRRIWVSSNQGPQWIETKTVETYFLIHSSSFLLAKPPKPEKEDYICCRNCSFPVSTWLIVPSFQSLCFCQIGPGPFCLGSGLWGGLRGSLLVLLLHTGPWSVSFENGAKKLCLWP